MKEIENGENKLNKEKIKMNFVYLLLSILLPLMDGIKKVFYTHFKKIQPFLIYFFKHRVFLSLKHSFEF